MLDALVFWRQMVGLVLNVSKTKILTANAQGSRHLPTPNGLTLDVLDRQHDREHRLQPVAKAYYIFHCHRWILCDQKVSVALRLNFFDAIVTSIAVFPAAHRKMYKNEKGALNKLGVQCRKLVRTTVGPPNGMDWTKPLHGILHDWNPRVQEHKI